MAEKLLSIPAIDGNDEVALFGDPAAATEHLFDFVQASLSTLGCYLSQVDDLAAHDEGARVTASTAKALLRQANHAFESLHEQLRKAGVGIFLAGDGPGWEPRNPTACVVRRLVVHHG